MVKKIYKATPLEDPSFCTRGYASGLYGFVSRAMPGTPSVCVQILPLQSTLWPVDITDLGHKK